MGRRMLDIFLFVQNEENQRVSAQHLRKYSTDFVNQRTLASMLRKLTFAAVLMNY